MKAVGIICFFDEPAAWLASSVASFCLLGLDHVVCCDGAYDLFPDGSAASGAEQHEALMEIVRPFGVGLTIHVPNRTWKSEMEKRSMGFALAEQLTTEDDWYVVFDADEMSDAAPLKRMLAKTDKLACECALLSRPNAEMAVQGATTNENHCRRFYRALRGLRVVDNHHDYRAGDLRLRGNGAKDTVAVERLPIKVEHRWNFKDPQRRLRQQTFYRRRDETLAERTACHCGEQAVLMVPSRFKKVGTSKGGVDVACTDWAEVCSSHLAETVATNERALRALGVEDPRAVMQVFGFDAERALHFQASTPS